MQDFSCAESVKLRRKVCFVTCH